jgi:hypothetical protein
VKTFKIMSDIIVKCPQCNGDGKETCHNPDHGFLEMVSFHELGRLGCPCCGHDENHKVKGGGLCDLCHGNGNTPEAVALKFMEEMDYDFELEEQ